MVVAGRGADDGCVLCVSVARVVVVAAVVFSLVVLLLFVCWCLSRAVLKNLPAFLTCLFLSLKIALHSRRSFLPLLFHREQLLSVSFFTTKIENTAPETHCKRREFVGKRKKKEIEGNTDHTDGEEEEEDEEEWGERLLKENPRRSWTC